MFSVETFPGRDKTPLRYGIIQSDNKLTQTARPMVYVPGLGGSVKFALPMLQFLAEHHGPIYSVDGRGIGLNEHLPPKPTPGGYLPDLTDFVTYLQHQGRLPAERAPVIIGLSLGAVYTVLYTTKIPHPFQAVVLLAPAFCPHPTLFNWRFRLRNYARFMLKLHRATTVLPYGIQQLTRNTAVYDDPQLQTPLEIPSYYLFLVEQLCRQALSRMQKMTLPTAVVIPGQDVVCDPAAMQRAFDRIPHPRKTRLYYPDLYHDVAQEPPEDIACYGTGIIHWLDSLSNPAQPQPPRRHQSIRQ